MSPKLNLVRFLNIPLLSCYPVKSFFCKTNPILQDVQMTPKSARKCEKMPITPRKSEKKQLLGKNAFFLFALARLADKLSI